MHNPAVRPLFYFLLLLWTLTATVQAAEVKVHADRNEIHADESFQLVFSTSEELQTNPDFTPLTRLFDVLNQSSGSNYQFINGRKSFTQSWTLNLMPKGHGEFIIPSIDFGGIRNDPAKITILPPRHGGTSKTDDDLMLEVSFDQGQVYVQGQLLLTLRIKHAVPLAGGSLSEPELSDPDAIIERLGDDRTYETRLGNKPFAIIERRYAIFPQHSGTLTLKPIRFDAEVSLSPRRAFDPFARNTTQRRLLGDEQKVEVLAAPSGFSGGAWLPAQSLQLVEQWPEQEATQWHAGEPITRTLAIIADGLTSAQLPPLEQPLPDGLKAYPDQPALSQQATDKGLIATRQEKVAIIPAHAGSFTLPAMQLKWWNAAAGHEETAQLPARTVTVLPAVDGLQGPPSTNPVNAGDASPLPTGTAGEVGTRVNDGERRLWQGLSGLFALLWLATLLLCWWRARRGAAPGSGQPARPSDTRALRQQLQQACTSGDARRARALLLELGEALWPDAPPTTLRELAERCGPAMRDCTEALDAALYAGAEQAWGGARLWSAVEGCRPAEKGRRGSALKPLYPA